MHLGASLDSIVILPKLKFDIASKHIQDIAINTDCNCCSFMLKALFELDLELHSIDLSLWNKNMIQSNVFNELYQLLLQQLTK